MPVDEQHERDFSNLYLTYYSKLLRFAEEYVLSTEDAENIVQDIFLKLWEKQELLPLVENINAYLFKLIRNRCLDYLKHQLSVEKYTKNTQDAFRLELSLKLHSLDQFDEDIFANENIDKVIMDAINELPDRCREIFMLSKIEGLKYKEISARLGISVNTVENQIGIALKKLRLKLKHYLPLLFFII
ncbi:RNA polymerase sigma-70 factor [Dysgonomonas sp. 25]|uniref:RNA polymerase sigma-70 factor n=1 Tax=Dysgonomonas sp. 25 TaxID=2302933 RepID=UPI0013D44439|nr:RNA polymerase sigma-70 factor [Dysgonomonas sp. 25]NDV67975.1 RNA polymerase sigma-70 factor [Dysgonomonas sp. 25]